MRLGVWVPLYCPRCFVALSATALFRAPALARFILSDGSVNKYGYRVLTAGISLAAFKKNPVMLWVHNRESFPVGRWEDIKVEGDKLTAEAVFDTNALNQAAQIVKSMVDQGILSACSIGFDPIEMSDDPKLLLPGQRRPTITKCELEECSICPVPANSNAVKLSFSKKGLTLAADATEAQIETLLPSLKTAPKMEEIIKALGLPTNATEAQVVAEINKRKADTTTAQAALVLKAAESLGKLNDGNRERYTKLAATNPELVLEFLADEVAPAPKSANTNTTTAPRLADVVKTTQLNAAQPNTAADPRAAWTMREWEKKDSNGLTLMKVAEPDRFRALYDAQYGHVVISNPK